MVHGGTWTAEAREPDRRQKVLDQLRLARQLRATLEQAADAAESASRAEARSLLIQHTPDISTLTCLTEAVKGRYTLDSYQYYTQQAQKRQEELVSDKLVVKEHLERLAQERPGDRKERLAQERPGDRRERPVDRKPAAVDDADLRRRRESRLIERRRMRRNLESRRCHDCKSTTKYFRRCNYYNVNGTKCGKIFCRRCLEAKYEAPVDDWDTIETMMGKKDWQ